jgi:hypothetical protein
VSRKQSGKSKRAATQHQRHFQSEDVGPALLGARTPITKKAGNTAGSSTEDEIGTTVHMLRRRAGELWWLAIPITTSLLIRIVHLLYSARYQELSEFLLLDSLVYLEMANAIRQGDWLAGSEVYSVGPLYGYILAAQQALVGDSLLASFAVQAVIGTATVVIVSLWARRFSGHWTASAAGLAYATYSAALLVENKVLGECYGVFLSITGTYLLAHRSKRLYQFIVAGICFGLACLIRPELLLFTPFALLWAAGFDRLGSFRLPFPRINWQAFVTCTVPLCFVISVVAVRNYHVADEAIFISSQGGITFYQGNNPRAEGTFSIPEGMTGDKASQAEESKLLAEQQVGRPLNQIEVNAHWMKRGITYLTTDLSTTLVLMGRKLRYWLSSSELTTEYSVLAERCFAPTLSWAITPFGLFVAAYVVGGGLVRRRSPTDFFLLSAFIASGVAAALAFFVTSRYRLTAAVHLAVFTGPALDQLFIWVKRGWSTPPLRAVVAALLFGTSLIPWTQAERFQAAAELYNLGNAHYRLGQFEQARTLYFSALQVRPKYWQLRYNLAQTYAALGDYQAAVKELSKVAELNPQLSQARVYARQYAAMPQSSKQPMATSVRCSL